METNPPPLLPLPLKGTKETKEGGGHVSMGKEAPPPSNVHILVSIGAGCLNGRDFWFRTLFRRILC